MNDYVNRVDSENSYTDSCYTFIYKAAPKSYTEAVRSADADKWKQAMREEMESLQDNDTFDVVELPDDKSSVGGRWVFAVKDGPQGSDIYKARYVAKGYSQTYGVDYFSTFAPTARMSTVRMVIQIAVNCDYLIHQMDVKSAYLNAPIDCELYMDQPSGFVEQSNGKKLVYRLKKSLYGLKQSASNWRDVLSNFFLEHGCKQSQYDPCIFMKHAATGKLIYVVWVDDIIVIANSSKVLKYGKGILKERFKMKDLGLISKFLGIEFIHHNDSSVSINQSQYLENVLTKFGMESCNPRSSPCEVKPQAYECDDQTVINEPGYRAIVGSLIYAMTCTRPDLSYVVTRLSQHLSKPNEGDWILLKQVLRYVRGTVDYSLHFRRSDDVLKVVGFSDSDWASCTEDRRSITGYHFQLCEKGPSISWKSRKQQTVALSTCEAEYMALCETAQEAVYLSRVFEELIGRTVDEPVQIYGDNRGSLDIVRNPVKHNRTKHIDIRYHFIRELYQSNIITVSHVASDENVADIMTKALPRFKYEKFHQPLFGGAE